MQIIADLQLHSKYSRAVSQKMDLKEIATWAAKKGINLVATGDWTHPLWFREIKANLKETSPGIFSLKKVETHSNASLQNVKFLLSTEISSIYTQAGKQRRVHNLIFSPSIETCEKIITELNRRGCNLMADGRPIVGISSKDLLELVLEIDKNVLLIPAHCLPPYELIETSQGLKKIEKINRGDYVLSHTGEYKKIIKTYRRKTKEPLYTITPWYYSQGIQTTGEHPFLAIKTIKKCPSTGDTCLPFGEHPKRCHKKLYKTYKKEWIPAKKLEKGDFVCFPIIKKTIDRHSIKLGDTQIKINEDFCLLIGYFLSEGCIDSKGGIIFTFSRKEIKYCKEVIDLMRRVFGVVNSRIYKRKNTNSVEIIFYSKKIAAFFSKNFYKGEIKRAPYKIIPSWMIFLPKKKQKQIIIGWFRGNGGYTSSIDLVSSINKIALRLGIIPYISVNRKKTYNQSTSHIYKGRIITANYDNYQIKFSFINDSMKISKEKELSKFKTKIARRHGYLDDHFAYLPIRKINKTNYSGTVYNLEVEDDHSYTTWVAVVHNCWTPWFSLYGSKSGFDSIKECFGELSNYIYAVETGLSSDPIMNWQIKELESRSIVSFSDAHSGPKLGREATVFVSQNPNIEYQISNLSYEDIAQAIKQNPHGKLKIGYTIEFFPEEGKYHWSGHRSCNVRLSPLEVKEKGTICPVCHRPLTVGVENRVLDLSEKILKENDLLFLKNKYGVTFVYEREKKRPPFVSLVPLLEILMEVSSGSAAASHQYEKLITNLGTEFDILLKKSYEEIERVGGEKLKEAIKIVRERKVFVDPGYDGVFGKVKIFHQQTKNETTSQERQKKNQLSLF